MLLSSYTKRWCIGIYGTTLIDVAFLKSHTLIVITNPNEWDIEVTSHLHKRAEGASLLCSHFFLMNSDVQIKTGFFRNERRPEKNKDGSPFGPFSPLLAGRVLSR